jgi:hypothetical protein
MRRKKYPLSTRPGKFHVNGVFHYEKANFGPKLKYSKSLYFVINRLEWSKKPYHANVPLNYIT